MRVIGAPSQSSRIPWNCWVKGASSTEGATLGLLDGLSLGGGPQKDQGRVRREELSAPLRPLGRRWSYNSHSCLRDGVSIKSPIAGSRELLGWWVHPRAQRVTHTSPVGHRLRPGNLPELALGTASSGCLLLSFIIAFIMNWQT